MGSSATADETGKLLQGSSKRAIALYLNEHGVPSPSAYRRMKGLPVSSTFFPLTLRVMDFPQSAHFRKPLNK